MDAGELVHQSGNRLGAFELALGVDVLPFQQEIHIVFHRHGLDGLAHRRQRHAVELLEVRAGADLRRGPPVDEVTLLHLACLEELGQHSAHGLQSDAVALRQPRHRHGPPAAQDPQHDLAAGGDPLQLPWSALGQPRLGQGPDGLAGFLAGLQDAVGVLELINKVPRLVADRLAELRGGCLARGGDGAEKA